MRQPIGWRRGIGSTVLGLFAALSVAMLSGTGTATPSIPVLLNATVLLIPLWLAFSLLLLLQRRWWWGLLMLTGLVVMTVLLLVWTGAS
ncbi:hypothetical protein [Permianibacter aggregans]|uniref:Uncharacterized protein n=1 Tax=Permianibacter aggregans TaxID=1510150 RepID=A0A4R6US35_9GAMM|nr:hypothetical protein [Permianibacter aggregans]QGX41051.1 hypothetical protein E2H98_15810 [Permianibacter aggregans]TDQ48115.1 hypothetical protein EV696_10895 [Permianibacter aggregans]